MFVIHDARDGKFNWVENITPNTAGIILVGIVNRVASTYIPEFGLKWCHVYKAGCSLFSALYIARVIHDNYYHV